MTVASLYLELHAPNSTIGSQASTVRIFLETRITAAKLSDPFWEQQRRDTHAEHVQAISDFVTTLRNYRSREVPHVAPFHGGIHARVLSVLADPGDKAVATGFLCVRNPDPTSRVQRDLMNLLAIGPRDLTPWNAYPWARSPGNLSDEERTAGEDALLQIVDRMSERLRVVFLQGDRAKEIGLAVQRTIERQRPGVVVVATCHPLGTRRRDREARNDAKAKQLDDWRHMARSAGLHT